MTQGDRIPNNAVAQLAVVAPQLLAARNQFESFEHGGAARRSRP
jgi:hypothetical protein